MGTYYFERALFVVGEPDSGKSTQLRSMFRDVRLGNHGEIPTQPKPPECLRLSNERSLYLRITSPHEMKETLEDFFKKTADKLERWSPDYGRRWNFASALQPFADNEMPDLVETVSQFAARFDPERIRIAFLSPDRLGARLQEAHDPLIPGLRQIPRLEVCWIDARDREANGLLLADFFDFT